MTTLEKIPVSSPSSVTVFRRILTHGPIGRVEIARATGLSQAAVTKAVNPLIAAGYLTEEEVVRTEPGVGRPVNPLAISADRATIVGVKITRDHTYGVLTDLSGVSLANYETPSTNTDVASAVTSVAKVTQYLQGQVPDRTVTGVGVTCSGDVDHKSGIVRHSPLLGWRDVHLRVDLEQRLALPVTVENDVRALTLAEQIFGAGKDSGSFAIVTLGEGIGCGLFLNGKIVEGGYGISGEIGHLPLAPSHLQCNCGRYGCVEAAAGSNAIREQVRERTNSPNLTLQEVFALAHNGDQHALAVFTQAGSIVGAALASLVNLVGPEMVIIAGEAVTEFDLYADSLKQTFDEHVFGSANKLEMILTSHTFYHWARGAAVSVIDAIATA